MVIPPLILVSLQRRLLKGKSLGVQTVANIGLIFATSLVALPFALAVFPQRRTISVNRLEDNFKNLKNKDGSEILEVEFNRGI
ncbi:unnamed protein product [[Candida] boidinii]|nr:unnamed protein product [[Candida] boidinii]